MVSALKCAFGAIAAITVSNEDQALRVIEVVSPKWASPSLTGTSNVASHQATVREKEKRVHVYVYVLFFHFSFLGGTRHVQEKTVCQNLQCACNTLET